MTRPAYSLIGLRTRPALKIMATGLILGACSGDDGSDSRLITISSQGAALTAVQNTEQALNGMLDSGSFLAESTSLADALSALGAGDQECSSTYVACDAADLDCTPSFKETCAQLDVATDDLITARQELRDSVVALVEYLRDDILVEGNLDAALTTDTHVTYRLGPSILCATDESDEGSTATPSDVALEPSEEGVQAPVDVDCVTRAEELQLRVRLSQPREGDVDMALIMTDQDYEPVVLQLYQARVGVKVDLAHGLNVMGALGENTDGIKSLSGLLQLQFIKNAPLDYSLQFSVLEDVKLLLQGEGSDLTSYSIGKTSPTIELRADGSSRTISARYNYGAMQLLAPLGQLVALIRGDDAASQPIDSSTVNEPTPEEQVYTGMVDLSLAGYTGALSYQADTDTFRLSDFSFGGTTSTLMHDGRLLAALDLNPNDGRGFDLAIKPETDLAGVSSTLVTVDPTIDFNLKLKFGQIADQVADLPEELVDDTLRVWFDGETPSFSVGGGQLRMVSGQLVLSSESSPEANVTVSEGMCLVTPGGGAGDATQADALDPPVSEEPQAGSGVFGVEAAVCE